MPAHLWYKAKRARTVTTFGNFHKSRIAGRRQHARRAFVIKIRRALMADGHNRQSACIRLRVTDLQNIVDLVRADKSVNFGHLFL